MVRVHREGFKADVRPCLVHYAFGKAALTTGHVRPTLLLTAPAVGSDRGKLEVQGRVLEWR